MPIYFRLQDINMKLCYFYWTVGFIWKIFASEESSPYQSSDEALSSSEDDNTREPPTISDELTKDSRDIASIQSYQNELHLLLSTYHIFTDKQSKILSALAQWRQEDIWIGGSSTPFDIIKLLPIISFQKLTQKEKSLFMKYYVVMNTRSMPPLVQNSFLRDFSLQIENISCSPLLKSLLDNFFWNHPEQYVSFPNGRLFSAIILQQYALLHYLLDQYTDPLNTISNITREGLIHAISFCISLNYAKCLAILVLFVELTEIEYKKFIYDALAQHHRATIEATFKFIQSRFSQKDMQRIIAILRGHIAPPTKDSLCSMIIQKDFILSLKIIILCDFIQFDVAHLELFIRSAIQHEAFSSLEVLMDIAMTYYPRENEDTWPNYALSLASSLSFLEPFIFIHSKYETTLSVEDIVLQELAKGHLSLLIAFYRRWNRRLPPLFSKEFWIRAISTLVIHNHVEKAQKLIRMHHFLSYHLHILQDLVDHLSNTTDTQKRAKITQFFIECFKRDSLRYAYLHEAILADDVLK
jgi:hypothetical protein